MSDRKKRVLFVEDDIPYARDCIKNLEEAGFEVHHVESDHQFDSTFRIYNDEWDVVIMDAFINGLRPDTFEFVKFIRKEFGDDIAIIANSYQKEYNCRLMEAGADNSSGSSKINPESISAYVEYLIDLSP